MARPWLRALGTAALLAGCLDPLVSDEPADQGLILPAGSEVPSIATDEEEAEELEEYDGVGDEVPLISAFAGGEPVRYWDFGPAPAVAAPLFALYRRGADDELTPLEHPAIIGAIPGDPGYSPFWAIWALEVTDKYGGEVLPSIAAVQEAERLELVRAPEQRGIYLNCPTVHPDVRLEVGAGQPDLAPENVFYYDGLAVPFFAFGIGPLSAGVDVGVADVYELKRSGEEPLSEPLRGVDMTGDGDRGDTNNIFAVTRDAADYTPLWRVVKVTVPAGYASIDTAQDEDVADYRSIDDLFSAGPEGEREPVLGHVVAFQVTDRLVNCPVQRAPGEK